MDAVGSARSVNKCLSLLIGLLLLFEGSLGQSSNSNVIPNATSCGQSPQYELFKGMDTEPDEYPWMALLEYTSSSGKGFYCGGFLVAERYVLTSAHCIVSNPNGMLTGVRLGEHNIKTEIDCAHNGECAPPPVDIAIDTIIVHEEYNSRSQNRRNDIALLRLPSKVTYSPYIQPICLPVINDDIARKNFTGYDLTAAGWGAIENTRVKLKVRTPVQELSVCNAKYNSQRVTLDQTQICAGGRPEKDSCIKASGGVLMAQEESGNGNWYAVGIPSFGSSTCGGSRPPDVYTKVASFSNWLSKNIK